MPRGIHNRKKKRNLKKIKKLTKEINYNIQESPSIQSINYENLYRVEARKVEEFRNAIASRRNDSLINLMQSVAIINGALAHLIGEMGPIR